MFICFASTRKRMKCQAQVSAHIVRISLKYICFRHVLLMRAKLETIDEGQTGDHKKCGREEMQSAEVQKLRHTSEMQMLRFAPLRNAKAKRIFFS